MSEIVGTLAGSKTGEEGSDRSLEVGNGSCGNFAKEIFETAEGHLDRIEVRRVFGQIAQRCACPLNDGADSGAHVDGAVIHHDNVIAPKRRNQALLDISHEEFGGHGPLPSGTEPTTRTPFGARPRSLAKLVLTAVSSRNTSRAGSSIH